MAFQPVRGLFSRSSLLTLRSRTHGSTIENGTFGDQQSDTLYGTRDVEKSAEFPNWSELARERKETDIGRYSHMCQRRCWLDAVESSPTQSGEDGTAVVHDQSGSEPTSNCHIDSRLNDRLAGVVGARLKHLRRLRPGDAHSRMSDGVALLCVSCAAFVTLSRRPSSSRSLLL